MKKTQGLLAIATIAIVLTGCEGQGPVSGDDAGSEDDERVYDYSGEPMCESLEIGERYDQVFPGKWKSRPDESSFDWGLDCSELHSGEALDEDGYALYEGWYTVQAWISEDGPSEDLYSSNPPSIDDWEDWYGAVLLEDTEEVDGWDEVRFVSFTHLGGELRGVSFDAIDDNLKVSIYAQIPTTEDGEVTKHPYPGYQLGPDEEKPSLEEAQGEAQELYDDQTQADLEEFVLEVAADLQEELRAE